MKNTEELLNFFSLPPSLPLTLPPTPWTVQTSITRTYGSRTQSRLRSPPSTKDPLENNKNFVCDERETLTNKLLAQNNARREGTT